jgi:hypothetical protein
MGARDNIIEACTVMNNKLIVKSVKNAADQLTIYDLLS